MCIPSFLLRFLLRLCCHRTSFHTTSAAAQAELDSLLRERQLRQETQDEADQTEHVAKKLRLANLASSPHQRSPLYLPVMAQGKRTSPAVMVNIPALSA